ncbi:transposase [Gemmata obscuriglobus]|uniref:transposase n=1 Tax=Gemmata obscuriglobus TaxID=114 RepID=UPI0021BBBFDD|nr:transposase [Gemmata obscuriglobus]
MTAGTQRTHHPGHEQPSLRPAQIVRRLDQRGRECLAERNHSDLLRVPPRRSSYDTRLGIVIFCRVPNPRTRYRDAVKVIVVCDNRNTHTIGAFYEAFDPETARALVRRSEFRHTPKHGSWLNVAECELGAMTRQCVQGRRFATIEELRVETAAWQDYTNDKQRSVDWQFRTDDARNRLKSLYPKIKT